MHKLHQKDLHREHCHFVWHVNVVPNTDTVSVLGHHDIAERHPLETEAGRGSRVRQGGDSIWSRR